MDDKDWTYLQAVYEEKNISRAAQKLHTSQPALTYRLSQLENYFDIKIFVRGRREIKFTPEGECLVQYAKKMSNELLKLKDQFQELKGHIQGELRLGVSNNVVHYDLPAILKGFHQLYPNVRFKVHSDNSKIIMDQMTNEEYHIAMVRGDFEWNDSKLLLNNDQICLISRHNIHLHDLPDLPRIKHKMDPLSEKVDHQWWYDRFSHSPYIFMEVDRPETCKEMVMQGLGYCILPNYMIKKEQLTEDLFVLPLCHLDGQPFIRNFWALYREEDTNLTVVKAFVDFLKQHYNLNTDESVFWESMKS